MPEPHGCFSENRDAWDGQREDTGRMTRAHTPEGAERYEVCEVVRDRFGARVLRVLAASDSRDGAEEAVQTIAREAGPTIGPIAIFDTATRLWFWDVRKY